MATIKSFSDLKQSRKLAEILPLESADMNYCNMCIKGVMYADSFKAGLSSYKDATKMNQENIDFFLNGTNYTGIIAWEVLPCWSLAALLGVLPKGTNISTPKPINELGYCCWNQYDEIYANNPIDACYEMILKLHELKML